MSEQKKLLTRVQLTNWHYFVNERIAMNGSTLISGENTAGKSTILDAIQLVLTTNTRRFNVAANEKSSRSLKGYVRCKIGNVGEAYLRKNAVPANVALEFYEEKGDRYFVLGVHLLSPDEESPVTARWYAEECRLEDLSFTVGQRPALAEEFRLKGKKIRYIDQKNAARDRFKRRLGNLDDKFFDIIPKSLAFKPMDNVKDFINKFVLSGERINVESLRENIETMNELEKILERSRKQRDALGVILDKYQLIETNQRAMQVNELLLQLANVDVLRSTIDELTGTIRQGREKISIDFVKQEDIERRLQELDEQILAIHIAKESNASQRMVEKAEAQINTLKTEIGTKKAEEKKLAEQLALWRVFLTKIAYLGHHPITPKELALLGEAAGQEGKLPILEKLAAFKEKDYQNIQMQWARLTEELQHLTADIEEKQERQKALAKRILTYPDYASRLKETVEKEFAQRGITSKIYYLSELLEINDNTWSNAVEGYLHTQKFYLVVEPEYYDIALEVYNRNRQTIHTAGIINSRKLPLGDEVNHDSLAYVVQSENRYARAYVNYLLGRVIRCEDIKELEKYSIAITPECMLYQGYVVRHLNPGFYQDPFIGQNAFSVQLANVKKEITALSSQRKNLREKIKSYEEAVKTEAKANLELLKVYLYAPETLQEKQAQLTQAQQELKEAINDPTLLELNVKLEEKVLVKDKLEQEQKALIGSISQLQGDVQRAETDLQEKQSAYEGQQDKLQLAADEAGAVFKEAEAKYQHNRKTKTPQVIADNFAPRQSMLLNEKNKYLDVLKQKQMEFNQEFTLDFTIGEEYMQEYREALQKLQTVDIVHYEEKLKSAKEDTEKIFRSDFLSKMKEYIESAKHEFQNLNKALDNIYYGDDSYHFKISFNKNKEGLYRMITSDNNQLGQSLWSSHFEDEYKEELADLFSKLMTKDDGGDKIVEEYTDYRSYLDYDIEITKKNGKTQRFSDIYGEKSGSETQVPYYVAIAASFYQLYRYGNSIRLMLLDEAFDKMDDERIQSMMEFFNGLGLQVILATPPAKIEIIGEKVNTILTAIRVNQNSIVEEYEL